MTPTDTVEQVAKAMRDQLASLDAAHRRRHEERMAGIQDLRHLIATLPDHTRLVEAARRALPLVVGEEEAEELEKALEALTTLET